jgi:hypothetical protein
MLFFGKQALSAVADPEGGYYFYPASGFVIYQAPLSGSATAERACTTLLTGNPITL